MDLKAGIFTFQHRILYSLCGLQYIRTGHRDNCRQGSQASFKCAKYRWEAVSWRSQIRMYSWRRVLHSDCFWILAALRALYTGLPMTEGQVPISAHLVGATIDVFSTGVWGKEFVWWFHTCMFYLTQWHLPSVLLALVREGCVSSSL